MNPLAAKNDTRHNAVRPVHNARARPLPADAMRNSVHALADKLKNR